MDPAELPGRWAAAASRIVFVPLGRAEVEREFAVLAERVTTHPAEVGARLVELGYRLPECLRVTVELLGELAEVDGAVLAALAAGFTEASRDRLFAEQEDLHAALRRAKDNVERSLKASEARFTEVFDTSALGMLITDLGGGVVRANEAIETMLGYAHGTLFRKRFEELLHPEDRAYLRSRYAELAAGQSDLRERTRLQRVDGDTVWTRMAVSVLRDDSGLPDHYVTMVEDISDLHLLEHRITYQGTHDMLTGLPNRSAFTSRLEEAIGVGAEVSVLHLSLEDFAVVNDGVGRHAGDRLLTTVASRLAELVEEEDAVVARIADHEFAILLRSADAGAAIAAEVNGALEEPTYVDGTGIAASATIAVVVRPRADTRPADLLRATDITIRELRMRGRRQWGLVVVVEVDRRVQRWSLTAAIPGAWENGELDVDFTPVVSLASGGLVAARAALRWDSPTRGLVPGDVCAGLLADTGMGVSIGRWLLSRAAERVQALRDKVGEAPRLYVELPADLAADADLVAAVRLVSAETGLAVDQVDIGVPIAAASVPDGPAAENIGVLAELGVRVVLTDFGAGDLSCAADLPIAAVRASTAIATRIASDLADGTPSLVSDTVCAAVPLLRRRGASVIVPGLTDPSTARWWTDAGADLGHGPLYGQPGPVEDLLG
ncbi:diguanylate cyclase [Actinokineospora soli]